MGEKWIARAIKSVMRQSYPIWELIIVDRNSSIGTMLNQKCIQQQKSKYKGIQTKRNNKTEGRKRNIIQFEQKNGEQIDGKV